MVQCNINVTWFQGGNFLEIHLKSIKLTIIPSVKKHEEFNFENRLSKFLSIKKLWTNHTLTFN